jgi:predicted dehydrogenase
VSLAKIDAMVAASRRTGRKLQVIFQERFMPVNRKIKEAIEAGRLGRLIGCHGDVRWWRAQSYYDASADHWRGTWRWDGGGSLMNQGVHTVDLIQWFMGPVESVFGTTGVYTHRIETEDKAAAVLKFESGAIGTINTMTCAYPGLATELFLHGERGSIEKTDGDIRTWRIQAETKEAEEAEEAEALAQFGPKEKRTGVAADPMALNWRGHRVQVEDMVRAIWEGRPPTITGESARSAVAVNLAVYESARTGREVRVKDMG